MTECEKLEKIRRNIANYKLTEAVTIVAASKTVEPGKIDETFDNGIAYFGENRVQELLDKFGKVTRPVRWHFIGRLQTNKVKYIIDKVSLIQSVDSEKLLDEIDRRAKNIGVVMPVLIEVNTGEEESKGGVLPEQADALCSLAAKRANVRLDGLMCVFPKNADKSLYNKARELFDNLKSKYNLKILSMGMSDDYVTALQYGSNMIRLGRAIFGERKRETL